MSWKDIIKNDEILKIKLVTDRETGKKYKKWDGGGKPPIGDKKGRELSEAINNGLIPYDGSGFTHTSSGHQAYKTDGHWLCLTCQVKFDGSSL